MVVARQEFFGKLRFGIKKELDPLVINIKMMQSMVYLILIFTLILIKWHVTRQEIFTT